MSSVVMSSSSKARPTSLTQDDGLSLTLSCTTVTTTTVKRRSKVFTRRLVPVGRDVRLAGLHEASRPLIAMPSYLLLLMVTLPTGLKSKLEN